MSELKKLIELDPELPLQPAFALLLFLFGFRSGILHVKVEIFVSVFGLVVEQNCFEADLVRSASGFARGAHPNILADLVGIKSLFFSQLVFAVWKKCFCVDLDARFQYFKFGGSNMLVR